MIEKKQWKGEWNFPGKTESYKGVLNFDPIEGARLKLFGIYESGLGQSPIDIITGKTTDGWVTLLDTRYESGQYSNETETGYALYKPSFILSGHAFRDPTELQFSSVHFLVSGNSTAPDFLLLSLYLSIADKSTNIYFKNSFVKFRVSDLKKENVVAIRA